MTVKELIEYLEKLPKDTVIGVVYQACSDYSVLHESDLVFRPNPENVKTPYGLQRRYVMRNGQIMEYNEKTWDPAETPKFISVLVLPGN